MSKKLLVMAAVVLLAVGGVAGFALSHKKDAPTQSATQVKTVQSTGNSNYYFKDNTLKIHDATVVITDVKVIPVGEKGNEYGKKPVIAFWFKTTNLTNKEMTPDEPWIACIDAYQDNNPNAENKLDVGSLPDEQFSDSQFENIKQGGTVEDAIAYELDDSTTPVVLKAMQGISGPKLGEQTFNIK